MNYALPLKEKACKFRDILQKISVNTNIKKMHAVLALWECLLSLNFVSNKTKESTFYVNL